MKNNLIVDTNFWVALFNKNDANHSSASDFLSVSEDHFLTSVPVITEVIYFLKRKSNTRIVSKALEWFASDFVEIINLESEDLIKISNLMIKYENVSMDFADASLVLIASRLGVDRIATYDKDFLIYRLENEKFFQKVPEVF